MDHLQHRMGSVLALAALLIVSQPMYAQQNPPAIQWQKSLGGSGLDEARSIAPTSDGGYIVAGLSNSNDGDVIGVHGGYESWIVKLTSVGMTEWQKSLGGSGNDGASSIAPTSDGGYIVAGGSQSNDGDVTGHHGSSDSIDYWVVKLTSAGMIEWQKSLGGTGYDYAISIAPTSNGEYIVAGGSKSTDGDGTGNHGDTDYWIVKLAPPTSSDATPQPAEPAATIAAISILPNPARATTMLRIESDVEAEYSIELVSALGTVVKHQVVELGIGVHEVQLTEMGLLPAGIYEVVAWRGGHPCARGRLVVAGQ